MNRLYKKARAHVAARKGREGSALVEFAIVAVPFFMLLFAILEIALIFTLSSLLENAAMETARLIRTGKAASGAMTEDEFKTQLCSRLSVFSKNCVNRLSVDVRIVPAFGGLDEDTLPDPMADGAFDDGATTWATGKGGDTVVVRIWYRHPVVTYFMNKALSRLNDGQAVLTFTTAFKNEPF